MDPGSIFRHVAEIHAGYDVRRAEFVVPSALRLGHVITVRRLNNDTRPVSQSDVHFLMHTDIPPGTSQVLQHHTGKPSNKFAVYMSSTPVAPTQGALEPPKRVDRARSCD